MQSVPLLTLLTRTQHAVAASASPRVRRHATELDRLNRRLASCARRGEWRQVLRVLVAQGRILDRIAGAGGAEEVVVAIATEASRLCAQAAEATREALLARVP